LIFWGSWCPPCRQELPMLQDLSGRYRGKVVFVGLAYETKRSLEPVRELVARNKIAFPQYVSYDQNIPREVFGLSNVDPDYPSFALFDAEGNLTWKLSGSLGDGRNLEALMTTLSKLKSNSAPR
jgi:thiol-disulfide isomerase/thioredoxin